MTPRSLRSAGGGTRLGAPEPGVDLLLGAAALVGQPEAAAVGRDTLHLADVAPGAPVI